MNPDPLTSLALNTASIPHAALTVTSINEAYNMQNPRLRAEGIEKYNEHLLSTYYVPSTPTGYLTEYFSERQVASPSFIF